MDTGCVDNDQITSPGDNMPAARHRRSAISLIDIVIILK